MVIFIIIAVYFLVLFGVSKLTASKSTNRIFMLGGRNNPWYLVAFGMIGASISGVSFVSVPGMVIGSGMTYLHMCLGFFFGYLVVAYVLLPLYYKKEVASIYSLLKPLGEPAYKTGATFFIISKMTGAAARFYVPCFIISQCVSNSSDTIPFLLTVAVMVALIWIYTRRGGIKTLVWTDTLQTLCMFMALVAIIYNVSQELSVDKAGMDAVCESVGTVLSPSSPFLSSTIGDAFSWSHFVLSFLSGVFVVIVMTGLDQDMMQKNLSCRSLKDAQKDMCTYGVAFIPANLLFLTLGGMLCLLCDARGVGLPDNPDNLLTMFALDGNLGMSVTVLFLLGIVAAAFSSADSSLTALTTCFCLDILGMPLESGDGEAKDTAAETTRRKVHVGMMIVFVACICGFRAYNDRSLIDAIYTLCGYTYGPLLGLFTYAILNAGKGRCMNVGKRAVVVCAAAPLLCYVIDSLSSTFLGYKFGYELLMLNGFLTYVGLSICHRKTLSK